MIASTTMRAAATCALLATTCLVTPAVAQTARAYRSLDANGVDLTHGDFLMSFVEGSIGSGEGELALVRNRIGSGNGFLHVSSGGHTIDGMYLQRAPRLGGSRISVSKDFRYELFDAPGTLPSGSSLSEVGGQHHYRTADGALTVFGNPAGTSGTSTYCNGSAGQDQCVELPFSITSPDGKEVNIAWEIWQSCSVALIDVDNPPSCSYWARIASVSNSFGYRIAFIYASNGNSSENGVPPPDSWQRRTGAAFYNDVAGGAAQAQVGYTYPSTGVVDVTDMAGRVWRFTGTADRISGIRRPGTAADTTSVTYSGDQASSVVRDGVTTSYARTVAANSATTVVTNALGQQATVVSDLGVGRPTSATDALGRTTGFQYDGYGRLTRTTAPEGNYVEHSYDARGNVTQTQSVAKSGSGLAPITTTAGYDAACGDQVTCNQPAWTRDAAGNQTDYTYDPGHGGVLTVTAPAAPNGVRPQTRYAYTLTQGEYQLTGTSQCRTGAACADTADEVETTVAYDANGNVVSSTTAAGDGSLTATATMTYDAAGNLLTVDGPLPGIADTVRARYDAARQLVGTVSPDPDGTGPLKPRATKNTIDARGLVTRQEQGTVVDRSDAAWAGFVPVEAAEIAYDANARPVTSRLTAGGTVHALSQTSYDALGRPECTAQRMNLASSAALPASACTLGTPAPAATSFGPDRIAKTIYDAAGQVVTVQTALGTAEQADEATGSYGANGQVETMTDGEGNRTTYVYDGFDRLSRTLYPVPTQGAAASSTSDYEQLSYDVRGNVVSRRLRDGQVIGYTYDALGRLVVKDTPNLVVWDKDISYAYDLSGRLTGTSDGVIAIAFSYDALGRKVSEGSLFGTTRSQYDIAGRRTRLTWRDGFFVTYDYLVTGEMSSIKEASGFELARFGYDDRGRRILLTRGNGTETHYGYDGASRLDAFDHRLAGTAGDLRVFFAYNPASQIVARTGDNDAYAYPAADVGDVASTVDGLNRLTQVGGVAVAHDARGNLTSEGSKTYGYTSENRLATAPGSTLLYDPLGRLFSISASATDLRYDGSDVIEETEAYTGAIRRRYVPGPGPSTGSGQADEPIVAYDGGGARRWFHADERGSIVVVYFNLVPLLLPFSEYTGRRAYLNATTLRLAGSGRVYLALVQRLPVCGLQLRRPSEPPPRLWRVARHHALPGRPAVGADHARGQLLRKAPAVGQYPRHREQHHGPYEHPRRHPADRGPQYPTPLFLPRSDPA